jgi:3-deoxy-7-phosphoheptulonate synthase
LLLDPEQQPGRLTLITRMGADKIEQALRPILAAVRDSARPVVWVCDPMHANTIATESGRKTRRFDDIMAEIEGFFAAHSAEGTWPGGVHLEITGGDVTECLGGGEQLSEAGLELAYQTLCDPRLNARQSLDLAFHLAELMRRS